MRIHSLAFVLALAILTVLPPALSAQEEPAEAPPQVRLLVYNIRAGLGLNRPDDVSPSEHLDKVGEWIRHHDPDLVLLQEIDEGVPRSENVHQTARLKELTGLHGVFAKAIDLHGGEYGLAILSRWPILDHAPHRLYRPDYSDDPDIPGWYSEQRLFQVVTVDSPHGELNVGNTHLGLTVEQRVRQIEEMAAHIESTGDAPWIVGGDINAEPDALEIWPLRKLLRDAYQGHTDARGLEYNIPVRQRMTFRADNPDRCIDYVFVSDAHWDVASIEVLDEPSLSDHRPILAVLQWRGGTAAE